jgi:hypothetical protein
MRAALIFVAGASLAYEVGVVSFAGFARNRAPGAVLKWYGSDAEALTNLAESPLGSGEEAQGKARALALSALQRSLLSAKAARSLAVLEATGNDQGATARYARYAHAMSRRDLATELLMIEECVRRNDVAGAIRHYDIALRTSPKADSLLLPILVHAAEHDEVMKQLLPVLSRAPAWRERFLWALLSEGTDPSSISTVVLRFADPNEDTGAGMIRTLLSRLVNERRYALAFSSYRRLTDSDGSVLIDGDFERRPRFAPIEWQLSVETDLGAYLENASGGGHALFVRSDDGRGGVLARQLIGLGSGSYRLTAQIGGISGPSSDPPYISLRCADGDQRELARVAFVSGARSGKLDRVFAVPALHCAAQWISIQMPSAFESGDREAWIDKLQIEAIQSAAAQGQGLR